MVTKVQRRPFALSFRNLTPPPHRCHSSTRRSPAPLNTVRPCCRHTDSVYRLARRERRIANSPFFGGFMSVPVHENLLSDLLPNRSESSSRPTFVPKRVMQLLTAEDFTYNSFVCTNLGGIPPNSLNLAILHIGGGGASHRHRQLSSSNRRSADENRRQRRDDKRYIWRQAQSTHTGKSGLCKKGGMFYLCNPRICYVLLTVFGHRSTFSIGESWSAPLADSLK